MPSLDERLYNWIVNEKGWFKIMIPALVILVWINIVTDGLNCDFTSLFQTNCGGQNLNYEKKIGACNQDQHCEHICNIWSKTRTKGSLVPSDNVQYRCSEGQCECNNYIEYCAQNTSSTCPWA